MKLNMLIDEINQRNKDIENLSKLVEYISNNQLDEELGSNAECDGSIEIMLRRVLEFMKRERSKLLNIDIIIDL